MWVLPANGQYLLQRGRVEYHAFAASHGGWFNGKAPAKRTQVKRWEAGLFIAGGKQDGVRSLQAAADKFQMHGGLVR